MTKVTAFGSVSDPRVYHDQSACKPGQLIDPEHRVPNPVGRVRCAVCERLDAAGPYGTVGLAHERTPAGGYTR